MVVKRKYTERLGLVLLSLFFIGACSMIPPRQVTVETVDPEEITNALKERKKPESPGLPPFPQIVVPATMELDLPDTLYSMTLNNVPLSAAIQAIMQNSELNMSVESDVDLSRLITVYLKQSTFAEAMDMVVRSGAGYFWTVENETLLIKSMMERIYALDYLDMPGETDIEVGGDMLGSSVEESGVSGRYVVRTSKKAEQADVWLSIEETLKTLKSEAGIVRTNRNGGLIYLSDTPKRVGTMVRFLDAMSEALSRQVYIEAKIMEVRLSDRNQMGIDWSALEIAFNEWPSPFGIYLDNFNLSMNGGSSLTLADEASFDGVLDFLRTQGEVSVVSNPHLALMNGRSALLTVGFQYPYADIDGIDRDDDTKVVTFGTSIKRTILGLQFGISVQISQDGIVVMNIVPTITRIQEEADVELPTSGTSTQTISNPIIDLQELSTTVRVREGNTVVIAGLISQVKDTVHEGLPILGDLPWVGSWFKHIDDSVQSRELVIFITPHIREQG